MPTRRSSAVALLLVGLLSACGGGSSPPAATSSSTAPPSTAPPSTAPPATTPAASPPPCVPAFVANALPDTGSPVGPPLGLQVATAAVHTGYDRVVFTLGGTGKPGWDVEYVATPTSDGSGDPVAVAGGFTLQVLITDVGLPGDTGVPDPAVKRFTPSGTVVVREVVLDTVFEGRYTAFIGVSSTLPFRVFRLAGPPRLVVDVRHC